MQMIISALGVAILLASAYGDVRKRRIPNVLTYSLAALGVMQLILIGNLTIAGWTIASSIAILVIGFLLFWAGFFGGGEVKLLAGAALLIGSRDLPGFLWLVSLCVLVALLALMIEYDLGRWLRRVVRPAAAGRVPDEWAAAEARPTPPYGIAIAVGAVVMLLSRVLAT
jgi:prepilin peptidase CpaA